MDKATNRIIKESELIKYSAWLETHGYMDKAWWRETPDAVNRYLDEQEEK